MYDLDYIDGYLVGFYATYAWTPGGPWTNDTVAMNAARDAWRRGFRDGRAAASLAS